MAYESELVVCEEAITPQKTGKRREYEYDNEKEVITKKKKTCEHGSPITLNENYASPKTICVRNLSYSVERADMEDIFKDCGEVVDVQFITDCEERFRGFGFVKFGTVEAADKALKLHNTKLLNRRIKVDKAREKSEYPPYRSSFHTGGNLHSHTIKGFDASLVENKPKLPTTPNHTNVTSKTVYVGNLSYTVERADMEKLFKDYGEIVEVRLHTDCKGKFNGHGHVQFSTAEAAQKALAMNKKVFCNRPMVVDLVLERQKYSPNESWNIQFQKCGSFQPLTVLVIGFNTSLTEEKIIASLHNHFNFCGEITRISLPRYHDSGAIKGYAHLDFKDIHGYKKALKLHQTTIGGYWVSVETAKT